MVPTVDKPVNVKTKQANVTKLYQLFLQQKFISLVSLMNKLILSIITMKKLDLSQPAITCSKLTIETLEQGVKYVQS